MGEERRGKEREVDVPIFHAVAHADGPTFDNFGFLRAPPGVRAGKGWEWGVDGANFL